MKLRLREKLGMVLFLGVAALLITPLRYALRGVIKQEHFYQRRPTSYWLHLLKDKDARCRLWAARNLGDLGPEPGVVAALTEALHDNDLEVHRGAIASLRTLGPAAEAAVPTLREAMRTGDIEDRGVIQEALTKIALDPGPPATEQTHP